MKLNELNIKGAYLIELEPHIDERGSFVRQFCKRQLKEFGLDFDICQCNVSNNYKAGTLRGMHYQKVPHAEVKLVSCFSGAFYDVIVDLREDSKTYLKWEAVELSKENNKMLYIPPYCAHGFQTLVDNTIVYYQLGNYFNPEFYDGIRWDDPKLGIIWPECKNRTINERDNSYKMII